MPGPQTSFPAKYNIAEGVVPVVSRHINDKIADG